MPQILPIFTLSKGEYPNAVENAQCYINFYLDQRAKSMVLNYEKYGRSVKRKKRTMSLSKIRTKIGKDR